MRFYDVPSDYIPTTESDLQYLTMAKMFLLIQARNILNKIHIEPNIDSQRMSKTYTTASSSSSYYSAWHQAYQKLQSKGNNYI